MSSTSDQKTENTFEAKLKKLEEIVETLEHETPSLEEALNIYEQGVLLARNCLEQLDAAELRVRSLRTEDE